MSNPDVRTIANRLVQLFNANEQDTIIAELYGPEIVSVEAVAMPGKPAEIQGLQALAEKYAWWYGAFEVHGSRTEGPFMHGTDRFAVIYWMDVTNRETQEREQMKEVGIYTVAEGKIVREEFFYT